MEKDKCMIKVDDLEFLIKTVFEDFTKSTDAKRNIENDFLDLRSKVKSAEKKKKDVDKIFSDCELHLAKYEKEMEKEEKEQEDRSKKAKKAAERAAEAQKKADLIGDGEDEDIKIVGSTFNVDSSSNFKFISVPLSYQEAGHQMKQGKKISIDANVVHRHEAIDTALQKEMISAELNSNKWPELKEGSQIYAKKFNDIWYPATLIESHGHKTDVNGVQYRVRFASRGHKVLSGKHVAYYEHIHIILRVGSRVIAFYRDDDAPGGNSYYAGIIAEAPSVKNQKRFLIFFDDGYAQYTKANEIHKVISQSANVWEDVYPESQDFIRDYLKQYPERPMVRLQKGQSVQTEWNGKWWAAKVVEVDASLVKMYFQADKRTEWIYRGSTRLEPLFKALANMEANKNAASSKGRRNDPSNNSKPKIVYCTGNDDDKGDKNRSVARKSTSGIKEKSSWEAPWLKYQRKSQLTNMVPNPSFKNTTNNPAASCRKDIFATSSISNKLQSQDMASVLQERLQASSESRDIDEEGLGERLTTLIDIKDKARKRIIPHNCSPACIKDIDDDPSKHRGRNPLLIPLLFSWERHVCKVKQHGKRYVLYRAPCARRLRSIEEVDKYLQLTDSQLTVDLFCMDPFLHTHTEFVPVKTFCDIKDLSYGKENVPISCVNGIDRQYPDYVEYSTVRIPAKGVKLNLDPNFLPGCDCTDGCRDASKCACQRLSAEHSSALGGRENNSGTMGYINRRLMEPIFTGIVECNVNCKCDKRCHNRVVQNGLSLRLQVFKTEKRGWGLRCLDDIPKGGFICIYAGQLLTDTGANEDGKQYGDEYLAELDFIEVVERQKEGYESDVEDIDDNAGIEENQDEDDDVDGSENLSGSDSEFSANVGIKPIEGKVHATRISKKKTTEWMGKLGEKFCDIDIKNTGKSCKSPNDTDLDELPDISPKLLNDEHDSDEGMKGTARKSTGMSRFGSLPNPKLYKENISDDSQKHIHPGTRSFFEDGQMCYIMDAKSMGNIGRYLNHCCEPNVFVQNIFVDTHDLRFPWVTFFAGTYIRAGTELTWDYNYEVGSVPDKILYCYCGSSQCRGRLL